MEYYTIKEVCDLIKTSRQTINTWIKSGKLKAVHFGKMVRIPVEEIEKIKEV